MIKVIKNGKIILKDQVILNKSLIFGEKIIDIVDSCDELENVEEIDAKGCYISPGFIDIHIHGAGGADTMDMDESSITIISEYICKNGVTSFLPTTMTMCEERILKAFENIRKCMNGQVSGAKVLGAHMEGPFINSIFKGAQDEKNIVKAEYSMIEENMDVIKIITIAPEVSGNMDFIKEVKHKNNDIKFSIGHTNATYEEAMDAINIGISSATHTFNAMTPLNHRKPGVVGAVMNSDVYCEIIADTIHVHPAVFNILGHIKGNDKMILITDAMRAACLKCGEYDLGGQTVYVDDNSARLKDGTLAGSILKLNEAIKNMKNNTSYSMNEIIKMVTINPATLIGEQDKVGTIEAGKYADLVIFDEDIDIKATIVNGEFKYKSNIF